MWTENESPNNQPMPIGQISDPLLGPGIPGSREGCLSCMWEGVDEDCQHPGQELEGRVNVKSGQILISCFGNFSLRRIPVVFQEVGVVMV